MIETSKCSRANRLRLVSLKEIIMQTVQVSDLVAIGNDLIAMRVPDVLKFIPEGGAEFVVTTPITEEQRHSVSEYLQQLQKGCSDVGLSTTLAGIGRILARLPLTPPTVGSHSRATPHSP